MTTATIHISYYYGKQTMYIPELNTFYTFHSDAIEPKNIFRSIRRECERKYGSTFGRVKKLIESRYDTIYEAQIEELCD